MSVDEPRPAIYIFPFFLSFLGQGGRMQIKDKTEDTVCVTPAHPPPPNTHTYMYSVCDTPSHTKSYSHWGVGRGPESIYEFTVRLFGNSEL